MKTITYPFGGDVTAELDSPTGVLPFGWEQGPDTPVGDDRETLFRFPGAGNPAPGTRRLLVMSLYAATLGLVGAGVGVRGFVSSVGGDVPGWYAPVLIVAGLLSVALMIGAFLSVHRRFLPYVLLLAAAVPLTADVLIAAAY